MFDFLYLLVALWVLHCIADYPLQGEFLAQIKGKSDYLLSCHCFIWAGVISIGLMQIGVFDWWKFVFLLVGHFAIDRWKARKEDKTYALTRDLYIDQALHALQLVIVLL